MKHLSSCFFNVCLAGPSWVEETHVAHKPRKYSYFCNIFHSQREVQLRKWYFFFYFLEGWAFLSLNKWIATLYTVFTHYPEKMRDRREQRKVSELRNLHDNRAVLFSPNQQSSLPSPMPQFYFQKTHVRKQVQVLVTTQKMTSLFLCFILNSLLSMMVQILRYYITAKGNKYI